MRVSLAGEINKSFASSGGCSFIIRGERIVYASS